MRSLFVSSVEVGAVADGDGSASVRRLPPAAAVVGELRAAVSQGPEVESCVKPASPSRTSPPACTVACTNTLRKSLLCTF